jgi:hypothetical protein
VPRLTNRNLFVAIAIAGVAGAAILFRPDLSHRRERSRAVAALPSKIAPHIPVQRHFADLGRLPIAFAPVIESADEPVGFITHTGGLALRLIAAEADISLRRGSRGAPYSAASARRSEPSSADLKIKFLDANQSSPLVGIDRLSGLVNYYLGHDPKKWRSGIPTFARVENRSLYPGIDLVYYGNGGQLEYDLNVAARADVSKVQLAFFGADRIEIEKSGDVAIGLGQQFVYLKVPVIYQVIGGERRRVAGHYVVRDTQSRSAARQTIGIELGKYDAAYPMVIDPVLTYSTYLGGAGLDSANQVALDSSGNNYLAGVTCSSNFPTVQPAQATAGGNCDAFVTEINSTGPRSCTRRISAAPASISPTRSPLTRPAPHTSRGRPNPPISQRRWDRRSAASATPS